MAAPGPEEACTRRMLQGFAAAGGRAGRAAARNWRPGRAYQSAAATIASCRPTRRRSGTADQRLPFDRRRGLSRRTEARWPRPHAGRHPREQRVDRGEPAVAAGPHRPGRQSSAFGAASRVLATTSVQQRGRCPATPAGTCSRTWTTVIAYRLLFGIYSGIVPDGIDDLVAGDIDWAGDSTILLCYVKGRTAAESLTLPRRAVRLLEQWLAHSALLRSHVDPAARRPAVAAAEQARRDGYRRRPAAPAASAIQRWVVRHATASVTRRSTVEDPPVADPHHLPRRCGTRRPGPGAGARRSTPTTARQVEGDHYLTATTPAQRRGGRGDRRGRPARPAAPGTPADGRSPRRHAAALARDYPRLVADAARRRRARRAGRRAAGCVHRGLRRPAVRAARPEGQTLPGHGRGSACSARWRCSRPGTRPNLLRLKAFFARQWQQMPAAQFMAVFGPYAQRIDQVLDRFDPAVLAAAARHRRRQRRPNFPCAPRNSPDDHSTSLRPRRDHSAGPAFAGADVCGEAGLTLPARCPPPGVRRRLVGFHRT